MKKILSVVLCLVILPSLFTFSVFADDAPDISAKSAVLIDSVTGRVLYARNENEQRAMASTTKIMTTLLCLESGDLDTEFVVDSEAIKTEGSSMGLVEGDIVTKRALCAGMLLPSGNDAANATAIKLAGSFPAFADMMNKRAEEIGMKNTCFETPSGLDGENHHSTAYDMALLTREALKNPDFAKICSQTEIILEYGNPPYRRTLKNTNKLLSMYDGCIGVKTGFTDNAGRCLISAAEKNGVTLICVTLSAPDDWNDHTKLLDYGFKKLKNYSVGLSPYAKKVPVVGAKEDTLTLYSDTNGIIPLQNGEFSKLEVKVLTPKFVYAPVKKGDKIGSIEYSVNGENIFTENLYASKDLEVNDGC